VSIFKVPLKSDGGDTVLYSEAVTLDGFACVLNIRWNDVAEGWFLDLLRGSDQSTIVAGLRLAASNPLLTQSHHVDGCPPGELMAYDQALERKDPGENDLGGRVILLYYDAEAVASGLV
jgi:hypothetical protein